MNALTRWNKYHRYPYLFLKFGAVLVAFALFLALLYYLRAVFTPILFSLFIAYALEPTVAFMTRKGIPRVAAGALIMLCLLILLVLFLLLVLPAVFSQVQDLIHRLPLMLDILTQKLSPFMSEHFGVEVQFDVGSLSQNIAKHAESLAAPSTWIASKVFKSVVQVAIFLFYFVLVIVLTFYFLKSYPTILKSALDLLPPRHRPFVKELASVVDDALARFIRGQVLVCVILACCYSAALTLAGVNGSAAIGTITGFLNVIPYVGVLTGLCLSLLSVALDYNGIWQVIAVLGIYGAFPLLDATLITPNVIGNRVGLNPLIVILALLIGAEILGFLGLLLAVPTAAVLRAIIRFALVRYRESRFYKGDEQEGSGE